MPLRGGIKDASSAITASSVKYLDANTGRSYLFVQNLDASIVVYVNFGAAAEADAGSIQLAAGQTVEYGNGGDGFVPTDAVYLIAASGTPAVTIKHG